MIQLPDMPTVEARMQALDLEPGTSAFDSALRLVSGGWRATRNDFDPCTYWRHPTQGWRTPLLTRDALKIEAGREVRRKREREAR